MCCYIVSAVHTVPITVYPMHPRFTVNCSDLFVFFLCSVLVLHDKTLTKEVFKVSLGKVESAEK